jgi:hypothetical protein
MTTATAELLDRYAAADPRAMGLPELASELIELRRVIDWAEGQFLSRLAAFDARGGYANDLVGESVGVVPAINSTVWLRRACHLTAPAANAKLRLARALRSLPATAAGLAAGSVSYEHARVIASTVAEVREPLTDSGGQFLPEAAAEIARATEDTVLSRNHRVPDEPDPTDRIVEGSPVGCAEGVLVRAGRLLDPSQLRRVAVYLRQRVDPYGETGRAERDYERRELFISELLDGVHHVKGILDAEGAAALRTAIHALDLPCDAEDHRSAAQRRADALVELCHLAFGSGQLPTVSGERPHLNILVPWTTITRGAARAGGIANSNGHRNRSANGAGSTGPPGQTCPPRDGPAGTGRAGNGAREASAPEVKAPEVRAPEARTPEVRTPEARTPEAKAPEVNAPETRTPEASAPEVNAPETRTPETSAPEVKTLEINAPEARAPEVGVSETSDTGVPGGAIAELAFAGPIDPETARRLACDAGVARIITDPGGLPLELGRRVRTVPAYLRRALAVRDRGCIYPGCDRPPERCEAHHFWHWVDGGPTDLTNTGLLCRVHHHWVHDGRWTPLLPVRARSPLPRGTMTKVTVPTCAAAVRRAGRSHRPDVAARGG